MELLLLAWTILVLLVAAVSWRKLHLHSKRIFAGVMLICSVIFLCWGWGVYEHNRAVFRKSFGGTVAEFKGRKNLGNVIKLADSESVKSYVGEDGKAHPDTAWRLGHNYFICSILFFCGGLAAVAHLLVRRRRVIASRAEAAKVR